MSSYCTAAASASDAIICRCQAKSPFVHVLIVWGAAVHLLLPVTSHCRLRDLESPSASTSAPANSITERTNGNLPPQRSQRQQASQQTHQPATRRDRQTTVIARQRSAPDKRKETAEDAKLREAVLSEVLDIKPSESWQDIAGLGGAKQVGAGQGHN